jgi:hypothetical protein
VFVGDAELNSDGTTNKPATPLTLTFDATGVKTAPTGPVIYGEAVPSGVSEPISLTDRLRQHHAPIDLVLLAEGVQAGRLRGRAARQCVGRQ